jgi:hypothetical protein
VPGKCTQPAAAVVGRVWSDKCRLGICNLQGRSNIIQNAHNMQGQANINKMLQNLQGGLVPNCGQSLIWQASDDYT